MAKAKATPTTPDDPGEAARVRPFADFLAEQNRGSTHAELSQALHDLVAAVTDTGRKGSVTLTVTLTPAKGDSRTLFVTDDVKTKIPQPDSKPSIFYPDRDGNLSRTDPNQLQFESLKEAPAATAPDADNLKDAR